MAKAVGARDVLHGLMGMGQWPQKAKTIGDELMLIDKNKEELIKPYLFALGIDVRFPIKVDVVKYRDLTNHVDIGYRFIGDIRKDKAYITSPLCDIMERISIASWKDVSLGKEMATIQGMRVNFDEGSDWVATGEKEDDTVPTYQADLAVIRSLQEAARSIRGGEEGQSEY